MLFLTWKHLERGLKEQTLTIKLLGTTRIQETFKSLNRLSGFFEEGLTSPPDNKLSHRYSEQRSCNDASLWVTSELRGFETKRLHYCSYVIMTFLSDCFSGSTTVAGPTAKHCSGRESKPFCVSTAYSSQDKNFRRE